ncbi:MAG: 2-dehydro-3-deoxygalactonokinase [Lachnospiraceae bacterium]|nr:2-dehydro-3-deoxygalactonokinase [Lachnospiraceae bacterium]
MKGNYWIYFDSGTSNSRVYVLDREFQVMYVIKNNVGSMYSAGAGSYRVLIEGLKELYDGALAASGITEEEVIDIYASGMVTSPYGLKEVPHLVLPITVQKFADSIYCHYEDCCFHRNIYLIPGLKTTDDDISFVNNMRGEEIEILGVLDEAARSCRSRHVALVFPGSHTHVTYVQEDGITGIISNFTGELFHVLKEDSILAPILSADVTELNPEMVKKGVENLQKFGFNRAIYICHAMRLFQNGTEADRYSYAEGVLNGGVRQSLEYYCQNAWKECDTVAVVAEEFMYRLFRDIFEGSEYIRDVVWIPISAKKSYAVEGLKKILTCKECV